MSPLEKEFLNFFLFCPAPIISIVVIIFGIKTLEKIGKVIVILPTGYLLILFGVPALAYSIILAMIFGK